MLMTPKELADMLGTTVDREVLDNDTFLIRISRLEIRENGGLQGVCGRGATLADAERDFIANLAGHKVVYNWHGEKEANLHIPANVASNACGDIVASDAVVLSRELVGKLLMAINALVLDVRQSASECNPHFRDKRNEDASRGERLADAVKQIRGKQLDA